MAHGRSFAMLARKAQRDRAGITEDRSEPRSKDEVDLWRRLMDPAETSIREFLEAKDLDGKPIFKISTKERQEDGTVQVPLVLWPNQRWLLEEIEAEWEKGHAAKLWLPKDREQGISFAIQAIFAVMFLRGGGGDMRTVSHKDDATKSLCDDFSTILSQVPAWVYRMILKATWVSRREGRWRLVFPDSNRVVAKTMTCRDGAMGRGDRLRWMHLSELPWWPRGQKGIRGALVTLRDTPGNIYVIESTGKGFDDFYHGCLAAKNGDSDWKCLFFSALTHPKKSIPFPDEKERAIFAETIGRLDEYDPQDEIRWQREGATLEQLLWRRKQIAGPCMWDIDFFRQEHAITFDDCFRVDSDSAFDTLILDMMRKQAEREWSSLWRRGNLEWAGKEESCEIEFVENRLGKWWMKRRPAPGHSYCFGCDPASGKKIVDQGRREGDFATIGVWDVTAKEVVLLYRAHTPPEDLQNDLVVTSKWYGWAKGFPEANNDGKVLLSLGYLPATEDRWQAPEEIVLPQMRLTIREGQRIYEPTLGFYSDVSTKYAAVSRLKRWVRTFKFMPEGSACPIPLPVLSEMRNYAAMQKTDPKTGNTTGIMTYGASSGHDDYVTMMYTMMEAEDFLVNHPEDQLKVEVDVEKARRQESDVRRAYRAQNERAEKAQALLESGAREEW